MSQFTNVAIYIKRAETHHTEEYIKNAFKRNCYGNVKSVKFIQKSNEVGQKYNGALVVMEHWFKTPEVSELFNVISSQQNKEYKMVHNTRTNRYWIIIQYTNPVIENPIVNLNVESNLPSSERIKQLELMVNSMSVQMVQLEKTNKQYEKELTQHKNVKIHDDLVISELNVQLEEEKQLSNALKEERDESNLERNKLTKKLISLQENIGLDDTTSDIFEEMNDLRNMIAYYDKQSKMTTEQHNDKFKMSDSEMDEYFDNMYV
jgi:hypothetical protein